MVRWILTAALALATPASAAFLDFPKGFKWCVATAAHQIEGGNVNSDWWEWEHIPAPGCKVVGCENSGEACDHWNRLDEDTQLLKDLNVQQYRFSIEWAKIEPKQGEIDWDAVAHYKRELDLLAKAGIEPMITLQHFTLPLWAARLGGWRWQGMPEAFERFTRFAYEVIAPGVRDWATFNEPMVHLGGGYVLGATPPGYGPGSEPGRHPVLGDTAPGKEDIERVFPPAVGLLKSHARAYHALHELAAARGVEVRVGVVHHLRIFDPRSPWNPLDRLVASILEQLWNWAVPDAIETGTLKVNVPFMVNFKQAVPGLKGTSDFVGVNYYTRDEVWFFWNKGIGVGLGVWPSTPTNDLGWEIYPEGFYRILKKVHEKYPRQAVLVTENGIADRDDHQRIDFLKSHLFYLRKAIDEGVPVEAYCHWSLMDNFEWVEGRGPRFGLYETDYATQKRIPRESARFYSRLAKENGFYY